MSSFVDTKRQVCLHQYFHTLTLLARFSQPIHPKLMRIHTHKPVVAKRASVGEGTTTTAFPDGFHLSQSITHTTESSVVQLLFKHNQTHTWFHSLRCWASPTALDDTNTYLLYRAAGIRIGEAIHELATHSLTRPLHTTTKSRSTFPTQKFT